MSADIQQARDVLAKWKRDALRGPWEYRATAVGRAAASPPIGAPVVNVVSGASPDIRLIVGMTDPDLLDAIDGLLEGYDTFQIESAVPAPVRCIAAAIIAADERMNA